MTTTYNTKYIAALKGNKWVYGDEAIKEMKQIEDSGGNNWDLYQDVKGIIYYIAVVSGCNSGQWGDERHYMKIYGKKPIYVNKGRK
ncbi:MAG TPA: hypothetical protein GX707_06255 [Epulopiscium sp.]|nr:hypothetical protein [Candidatus Epulonipiscium sp.]